MVSDVLHIMSDLRSTGCPRYCASAARPPGWPRSATRWCGRSATARSQFWDMVYATPPRGDV